MHYDVIIHKKRESHRVTLQGNKAELPTARNMQKRLHSDDICY